jgi:cytochrome c oxidase assembly protein subunit 11
MKLFIKPSTPAGLLTIVVLMFAFGFMLVPLYTVFCEITGLNGKTSGQYQGELTSELSDNARNITVQFVANRNANLAWPFSPQQEVMELKLGERKVTSFRVVNTYDKKVVAQAVPSVSPAAAASHLHKIECFCFEQQVLGPSESKDMPLVFFVDESLPEGIKKLTLSYTLFDITGSDLVDM